MNYKEAGVDKELGYKNVENIKQMVKKTYNSNVLNGIGSFAALYELGKYKQPVLVSGTDGVGTKLKVAFELKKYDTVGIDLVAMCVNDILCQGAKPLFFLDYLACSKLDINISKDLIQGIVDGCIQSNMALIGGESAEMPGFYQEGDYDIAGFAVGVVEKDEIIDGSKIEEGDVLIALPSSGIHSNGYSLVRKLFNPFIEDLLIPTRIYVKDIFKLLENEVKINGLAHITGGGLIENVPRIIPNNLCASIEKSKVKILDIFKRDEFKVVNEVEMWGTFNMGVGMVIVVNDKYKEKVLTLLKDAYIIGSIEKGNEKICLK